MKLVWRVAFGGLAAAALLVLGAYPFGSPQQDLPQVTEAQPIALPVTERTFFDPLDTPMLRRFFQKYNSNLEVNPERYWEAKNGNDPNTSDEIPQTEDDCSTMRLTMDDKDNYEAVEIQVPEAAENVQLRPERENVISWQEFMDEMPEVRFPSTRASSQSVNPVNVYVSPEQQDQPLLESKSSSSTSSSGPRNIATSGGFGAATTTSAMTSTSDASSSLPQRCRLEGVVTVQDGGRLGNKLWEYAAVWALGHALNLRPLVPSTLSNYLKRFFQDLSVDNLEDSLPIGCPTKPEAFGEPMKRWRLFPLQTLKQRLNASTGGNLVLHRWIILPEPVIALRGDPLKKEFRFHQHFVNEAERTLRSVAEEINWRRKRENCTTANVTFVGVHVRRTDFAQWLPRVYNKSLATATYFRRAMDHFRKKINGPVAFLVVSDDPSWAKANLGARNINPHNLELTGRGDVFLGTKEEDHTFNGIGHDFALLSICNHSIIDYGTFGAWGALMAGGNTISLESDQHLDKQLVNSIPGWTIWNDPGILETPKVIRGHSSF